MSINQEEEEDSVNFERSAKWPSMSTTIQQARVRIDRPAYTNTRFESEFRIVDDESNNLKNRYVCQKRFKQIALMLNPLRLLNLFTILDVLANYKCKLYLVYDIMSGVTG